MTGRTAVLALSLLLSIPVLAQKVKYKDLFVLLNAKQFDQAEPFLRKYLKENDDNPNAFLYMGMILQEKSQTNDALTETEILLNNLDSSVYYYDRAYKTIDDREIRKNDEYYQAYNRRDLRTGKFGVKLSDVQFDLEKRMEGLKEKSGRVKLLNQQFKSAEGLYAKSNFLYKDLQLKYHGVKQLFLQSNAETLSDLKRLKSVFDSCVTSFNGYKATSQLLGKTGHNQVLTLLPIRRFEDDGIALADFMQDELRVWDYGGWASATTEQITKEIAPLREQLVAHDIALNKLREKLKKDSVSVESELVELATKSPKMTLLKYDPDPMPVDLFGMKTAELQYASRLVEHKPLRDSVNVNLQISLLDSELKALNTFDSLTQKLLSRNLNEDAKDYEHFVTTAYGTVDVLKNLVQGSAEYSKREQAYKSTQHNKWNEALKWVFASADSVPLFKDVDPTNKYQPLIVVDNKYTAGLTYADSVATGYFYTITPSHRPSVSVKFPVSKSSFTKRKIPVIKGQSASDENGQLFYIVVYSQEKEADKFPATVAKIYRTDGLAWTQEIKLDLLPSELAYNSNTGELLIKTTGASGESKMVVLDKNGKTL